jgi:hypothetical protein
MTGATTKYFDTLLVFASKTMMSSLPKKWNIICNWSYWKYLFMHCVKVISHAPSRIIL